MNTRFDVSLKPFLLNLKQHLRLFGMDFSLRFAYTYIFYINALKESYNYFIHFRFILESPILDTQIYINGHRQYEYAEYIIFITVLRHGSYTKSG